MNSAEYQEVLETNLVPFLRRYRRIHFTYQQDNATIHISRASLAWFADKHISLLSWPARSPDLNPIENLWGILVRQIYANNRQYGSVCELKTAIMDAWGAIDKQIIQNLVNSMHERIFQLINRNGGVISY